MNPAQRFRVLCVAAVALLSATLAIPQAETPEADTLAAYLPTGALFTVESPDFGALWSQWNASPERQVWLSSANRDAFLRSSLYYQLSDARTKFSAAAKLVPDEALVNAVAGQRTILGAYDIGSVAFVYVTEMSQARVAESALWRLRPDFEPRQAGEATYYVRSDEESERVFAFAATDSHLIAGTREDLVASVLEHMAGQAGALASAAWYRDASAAATTRGDLRLVLDLNRLTRTPHFRTYWIQRNITELRQYRAGVADLSVSGPTWSETRAFLRENEATVPREAPRENAARLAALVPAGASYYRAWAEPRDDALLAVIRQKVLEPGGSAQSPPSQSAPRALSGRAYVGSTADLEIAIDVEPPRISAATLDLAPVGELLASQPIDAAVVWQASRLTADQTFVRHDSTIILGGQRPWNGELARDGLRAAAAGLRTAGEYGAGWIQEERSGHTVWRLGGLLPLAIAMRNNDLCITTDVAELDEILAVDASSATGAAAEYAGFRHATERPFYVRLMDALDFPRSGRRTANSNRPPALFSENIASLSRTLLRMDDIRIETTEEPERTLQTVHYGGGEE